ncbi:MAG: cytidylate kinase family protein [Candidatus Parvarchaeota archaeon]|jgi:cytidylate kinase|nr:cytidylate kinase family protein [Candidatus Parvarchaeota archaeon]MCL5106829.1 cytidylate kinase family protein [Candidatus Parvarchaeota archaeon]
MKVVVSGLTASGKSSVATSLALNFGIEYFSASSKLRKLLPKKDFMVWESKKGIEAVKFRLSNPQYDKKLDSFIISYFKAKKDLVLDSWVAPWKIKDKETIKIYIKADEEVRAKRVSIRDKISLSEALKFMREKDAFTKKIYKKIYGIEIDKDFTPFNLVIDSSNIELNDVIQLCSDYIMHQQKTNK